MKNDKLTKKKIKEEIEKSFPDEDIHLILIEYDKDLETWDIKLYNPVRKIGWFQIPKHQIKNFPKNMIDHFKWQLA